MSSSFDPDRRDKVAAGSQARASARPLYASDYIAALSRLGSRLRSAMTQRKVRRPAFETTSHKLTVIMDAAGDIVATAFEQDLRIAGEGPQAQLLAPRPGQSMHEIIVPGSFRQMPWHEVHARVQQHPLIWAERDSRVRTFQESPAAIEAAEAGPCNGHASTEDRGEQGLEPIEIRRPLIVVPGILGSDLWTVTPAGRQGSQLWPPYTAGGGLPELAKVGKLDPAVPKLAVAGAIFQGVYGELLAALRQIGYEDSPPAGKPKTLWTFPYDWTMSCDHSGKELAAFIADTVLPSRSPSWEGVDIVNHSMGGLVTRAAKQLHGAPIARSAYIASPHNGSASAYLALHPAIGVPFFDRSLDLVLSRILNSPRPLTSLQQQVVKWKSAYDLLPDDRYGPEQSDPYGRFPAAMQDEIRRARSFKARLAPEPTEKHIIFSCNNHAIRDRIGWKPLRKMFPALRFLTLRFDLAEDAGQATGRPAAAGTNPAGANPAGAGPISVDGAHLWVPSMPTVHASLREFLAAP
jgi:hypothetical protein